MSHEYLNRVTASSRETVALERARTLSAATLAGTILLLALGTLLAAVDGASACEGWPLCTNQSTGIGLLNVTHRIGSLGLIGATGALAALSYARLRAMPWLTRLTAAIFTIVLAQSVMGGLGVAFDFPGWASAIHLALALTIAIGLAATTLLLAPSGRLAIPEPVTSLAGGATAALALTLIVAAAFVGRIETGGIGDPAGAAGIIFPSLLLGLGLTGALVWRARRDPETPELARRLADTAGLALAAGVGVLAAHGLTPWPGEMGAIALVLAMFAGISMSAIVIGANGGRLEAALGASVTSLDRERFGTLVRDYLRVTKPGIMLLLLTTTLGAMLVAAAGWPGFALVGWTLLGGALASGGASALNCYIDRDIDQVMARTRKRPIPTGSLTPAQVRNFALTLSIASALVLATFVNPLAALLAVGGNLFYVIIYTIWLKRTTPQNIVIGGAAGSFPPLVGWAAVTGSLSVAPLLIAAIIFFWTPPHFWSLALLKANDYRRAGVPMLPVSHGEPYTRRSILLYTLLLIPITLLLAIVGPLGWIYLISASLLGAIFIAYAWKMYHEDTNRLAWRLFKFSNYYLALLLALMVVDAVVS
ncbi:MAG TPA: heme o synthase [Thermomicrobiales bacterium]|nr:heme o synthase [Thermomicrobiales bacterium]